MHVCASVRRPTTAFAAAQEIGVTKVCRYPSWQVSSTLEARVAARLSYCCTALNRAALSIIANDCHRHSAWNWRCNHLKPKTQ
jgi:hypothetical protein